MGRVFRPVWTRPAPAGGTRRVRSKSWYAEWATGSKRDGTYKVHRVRVGGDKRAAESFLARQQERADRARAGLPEAPAGHARPLTALRDEYLVVLAARDTSPGYRSLTGGYLTRTIAACGWLHFADVRADDLTRFLGRLRDTPPPGRARGRGPATLNGYLRVAKAFARWVADRLGVPSPLRGLRPYPEDVDRRRSKRILTDAELARLVAAAAAAPRRHNTRVPGPDRAMLYRVAAYTGLRAGELATLAPESFALDAAPPVVTVAARDAKGRREEPVPLPSHLVAALRPWLDGKPAGRRLWPGNWAGNRHQCDWLARDLARAGVAARDDRGRNVTFHSLKRRFVTRLIEAGGRIHEVRRMARHKDVATTLNYYTDVGLGELKDLTDRLPGVG